MILLLIIGLTLTALAVTLMLRAFNLSRVKSAEAVGNIDSYGFSGRTETVLTSRTTAQAAVDDLVTRLGELVSRRFKGLDSESVRRELVGAGLYSLTPRKFAGYRAISTIGVPALCIWALAQSSQPVP